ncbi:NuA4 histone acetyltransferase subunit [Coemansia sp. RSA 2559]|nr:NuA4 histone acetyltransferase subunit [Coemansia sp. RSA 2559]KAJ2869718.1 NuA4 histone acetyltransferase subunit [Coemansia erecta]
MPTYGGDEVNALVLDVGSTWTRAGFAGEDMPKAYFPSRVGYIESEGAGSAAVDEPKQNGGPGSDKDVDMEEAEGAGAGKRKTRKYFVGDTESATWRGGMEMGGPMEQGLVKDWDMYERIWEYALKARLRVRAEDHPVMVSEAAWNTGPLRAKLIEMAFEKFGSPAFYVCKTPVLAAFGTGRHTGLVVDVGGENTSACAVYEGFCLTKTVFHQETGGELVSEQLLARLKSDFAYEPTPIFDIKAKAPVDIMKPPLVTRYGREDTRASFVHEMRLRAMQELKETTCEVIERPYEASNADAKPTKPFEFPDGFNLSVGRLRYAAPEILFNPNQFISSRPSRLENVALLGVHEMALKSVMASDVDLRPQLLNSVVVAGGSALFPGFNDRLSGAMQSACPGSRLKLYAPSSNAERKVTAWLGGSVLASLGTFHQLWISRAEYDEHGASIVDKKCQ